MRLAELAPRLLAAAARQEPHGPVPRPLAKEVRALAEPLVVELLVIAPEQRELMKLRIQEGLIAGVSPGLIWGELGIDKKTYYRMVDELAGEASKERLHKTDRLLHSYLARAERVFREFDAQYRAVETPSEGARIQGLISTHLHNTSTFLQSCGFLPKKSDKLEIAGKVACINGHFTLTPELAEQLAKAYRLKEGEHEKS